VSVDSVELQPSPSPEPAPPPSLGSAGEPSPASAPDRTDESSDSGGWWSRFLHTRGHHTAAPQDDSPATEQNGEHSIAQTSGPRSVTLTEEELNARIQRGAQSLHDRETARRNRENAEAERRRLRDEDPYRFAQQDKQREDDAALRQQQTEQLMTLLGHVGKQHDAVSIDPIINALPEPERRRILDLPTAGQGLPGRKLVVDEALKAYSRQEYERGYRDAQAKLRKDPVFRKSVLSELRGTYQEPELYSGNGSPQEGLEDDNVSSILRRQYFQR
jgi:hypothetical protein